MPLNGLCTHILSGPPVTDEEAAEFECLHEWMSLREQGLVACSKCSQVMWGCVEFAYVDWRGVVREGNG